MKPYYFYLMFFCVLSSCIIDTFDPVLNILNDSSIEIRIYFSNNGNIDTVLFKKKSSIVSPQETYTLTKGISLFDKNEYADTSRKLYLFIFDNSIFKKMKKGQELPMIAAESFLERKIIDIRQIKPKDTIFVRNGLRN